MSNLEASFQMFLIGPQNVTGATECTLEGVVYTRRRSLWTLPCLLLLRRVLE